VVLPNSLKGESTMATATTKKRTLSPEGRKKIAEAQKKRWAAKESTAANTGPVFNKFYVEEGTVFDTPEKQGVLSFSVAIEALKKGLRVARTGWNGIGMFVFLVPGSTFKVSRHPLLGIYPEGTEINYRSHIDMKTADGSIVPWVASQTDVLAEDWIIL
jgi:hypothetical protein